MKKSSVILFLSLFSLLPALVFAQRGSSPQGGALEVKLASFMPKNSDWGNTLNQIAAEWARVTQNRVRLRIISEGLEGNEKKTLSSLSTNNIQAALFTSFGLHSICPSIMTLSVPFCIRNDAELDLVLKDALPFLEAQADKKYVVLAWSKAGWVNVFSRNPVYVPNNLLSPTKLATNPDASGLNTAFKEMGFHLIETDMGDMTNKLGQIDAIYQLPASVVLSAELYKNLNNMMDIPIAPFMGGIVINQVTWNKISPADQAAIKNVTRQIAERFDAKLPGMVASAVSTMQKNGLKVNKVSPDQEQLWQTEIQKAMPSLYGNTFDRELYEKINEILKNSRSGQ